MKFVSPVCTEGTTPFSIVAQRLKIVQLSNVKPFMINVSLDRWGCEGTREHIS